MDMLELVQQRLKDAGPAGSIVIAEGSGVPLPTLTKIRLGQTKNPGIRTVEKLYRYLTEQSQAA